MYTTCTRLYASSLVLTAGVAVLCHYSATSLLLKSHSLQQQQWSSPVARPQYHSFSPASTPVTPASPPLALLQYVVFPADPSGTISCELWVEPQCGTITDTSPGLEYLNNLSVTEIANKVCTIL